MTGPSGGGDVGSHPAYIGVMIPICVLGGLLNIVVIVVVVKYHKLRTSVDIFLTNLAVSETLQALVVCPIYIHSSLNQELDFYGDAIGCKLVMFVPLVTVMLAILSIVAMAIDRYRCIINNKTMGRRTALIWVGLVWLVSFIVSSPQLYEYSVYQNVLDNENITIKACGADGVSETFKTVYASLVFSLAYGVPLAILFFCYTRIMLLVWRNANMFLQKNPVDRGSCDLAAGSTTKTIMARKMKVLKLLINLTASFTILWMPYFIVFAIKEFSHMDDSAYTLKWQYVVGRTLAAFSSVVNPLIFIWFSNKCRLWIKLLCACKNPCQEDAKCSPTTTIRQQHIETENRHI